MQEQNTEIKVYGARVHNLKNIDITIPRNQLVCITGLSGSGKSSLAFDTIYAEGQRRYIETFSAYARNFLGNMERPDVDKIDGLSPVIAIEQKTTSKNPRSTVGTITEIYDFIRLLYARAGEAHSIETGEKMVSYSQEQIVNLIQEKFLEKRINILAPVVKARKGHYRELFERIYKQGFIKVRVNGTIKDIEPAMRLSRYKTHDIEIVIDRLKITTKENEIKRLNESIKTALYHGDGSLLVLEHDNNTPVFLSENLVCPSSGISYAKPEPNTFSFNSPKGACKSCNGLGSSFFTEKSLIIPDNTISIANGGIVPLGKKKNSWIYNQIETIAKRFDFTLNTPIHKIPKEGLNAILYGHEERFSKESKTMGITQDFKIDFEGIIAFIEDQYRSKPSTSILRWAKSFMTEKRCATCNGARLKQESLYYKIADKSIGEIIDSDFETFYNWILNLEEKLNPKQRLIARDIIKEIKDRTEFLLNVGLNYLSLNRSSKTLSGGESQRIRLATQIGTQLVNVLYILDEPSIGLHQRDNKKLITSLKRLRDLGNSVIVVEHDREMIEESDYLIDIGPGAGKLGGEIVMEGKPELLHKKNTLTAKFINGEKYLSLAEKYRKGNGKTLSLLGAIGNNLKNVDLHLPLGKIICVTGVSGSGKSSLIQGTLFPVVHNHVFKNGVQEALPYKKIKGLEHIDKTISIDQSPIGRTPRSNPATYTGVFAEIRSLFAKTPEAKIRGYKTGRFSFNVKDGRCEKCEGAGLRVIEMNFMPDVQVHCESCQGKRFNRETLEVRYKGKSIFDVLDMTIDEAVPFFEAIPKINRKIKTLQDVGLGYITLGQQSTTLSGGEAQRIKLATELSKRSTGNTLYILDEPTTGLHFQDISVLMDVLHKLADKGNTILIIEHNLDVIKLADWIIDIGPDGGNKGGEIIIEGTPEKVAQSKKGFTAKFLKEELELTTKFMQKN